MAPPQHGHLYSCIAAIPTTPPYIFAELFPPDFAIFIGKFPRANLNQIDQPANAKAPACQQPDNASADFSCHEPMYAEASQKQCNQYRRCFTHFNHHILSFLQSFEQYPIL